MWPRSDARPSERSRALLASPRRGLTGQDAGMGMVEARQHGRQLVLVEGALAQQVGERQGGIPRVPVT